MKVLFVFLASLPILSSSGQTPQKIGHADWEFIFSKLPEYKQIQVELTTFETQLQNQLKAKVQEIEAKYKAYTALPANAPDAIRRDKESELAYLQENVQKFQEDARTAMQKKQSDLMTPVFAKVGKAIEEVALQNGFSYIINPQTVGAGDLFLFTDEKYNISDLVLKQLGIDLSKEPATPTKKN